MPIVLKSPFIAVGVFLAACQISAAAELTPSPAVLITDRRNGALVIADPKDQHVVASIPVGTGPHEIAVSTDGKLALVSNFDQEANTITLVDLAAQKQINRYKFPFRARPNSLVYADGKFWFTAEDANSIGRYDPATNTVDLMVGLGQLTTHVMLYNPADRSFIASSRNSDSVSFIDPIQIEYRGNKRPQFKVTTISAVHWNEAMDFSPERNELWVAEFRGGKIAIIDMATRTVKERFEVTDLISDRLKFTPDGKRVLLSDLEKGNLVVYDAAARREIKRLKLGAGLEGVSITPDGSTAYVAAPGDNAVVIVDLRKLEVSGRISVPSPLSALWVP
jgi:YVTN family beta-propeller protein